MPLISYRTCTSGHQLEAQLRMRDISPEIVFRSDDNGNHAGPAVDLADPRSRAVDMSAKVASRLIGVAWHRDRLQSGAARSFIDLAGEVCDELRRRPIAATGGGARYS